MRLAVAGPLDLDATLYSGQAFRWRPQGRGHAGWVAGVPVHVTAGKGWLRVDGQAGLADEAVAHYFRLDGSHEAFLRDVPHDPLLAQALAAFDGLRLLRQDPWEALIGFILSQNSNEGKIRRTIQALCRMAGDAVHGRGDVLHAFPTPEALSILDQDELRATGMGYRAPYVAAAAHAVADGDLDLAGLQRLAYPEALARLTALPGVGEKVADCVLLYGCGRFEAVPADVWVRRIVAEAYYDGPNKEASYAWIRRFAGQRFGPWAGYAQHVLFHWRRTQGRALPGMNATNPI